MDSRVVNPTVECLWLFRKILLMHVGWASATQTPGATHAPLEYVWDDLF